MKLILTFLLVGYLVSHSSGSYYNFGIRRMDITQPEEGDPPSTIPVIQGTRNCGGPGKVVAWRYETCGGDREICQVPGNDDFSKTVELEFIPSQDISSLGARQIYAVDGATQIFYDKALANSAVQGGERYIVHATAGAKKDMRGKMATIQYILYRVETGEVEVCVEADFQVV